MSGHNQPYSTALIILMFIIFWPIGIYMLIANSSHEEKMQRTRNEQARHHPHGGQVTFTPQQSQAPQRQQRPMQNQPTTMPAPKTTSGAIVGSTDVIECKGCGYKAQVIVGYASSCTYCGSTMISRPDPNAMAELTRQQVELEKQKTATAEANRRKGSGLGGFLNNLGEEIDDFFEGW